MAIKIRTKIIASIGSIFILLSLLGVIAVYNRNILFRTISALENGTSNVEDIGLISIGLEMLIMPANDFLITGDIKEKIEFKRMEKGMEEAFLLLKDTEVYKREPQIYQEILSRYSIIKDRAERIFSLKAPVGNKQGALWMKEMDDVTHRIIASYLGKAIEIEKDRLKNEREEAGLIRKRVDTLLVLGAAMSVLIVVLLGTYLVRSILSPLVEFQKAAHTIGEGRLEHRIDIMDGFEMNLLADDFNEMTRRLKESYEGLEKKVEERTRQLNELNERLKELSITDGLTGVYNHRHFYETLGMEIKRAGRYKRPMSLIMIDIDHFKHYNDTHGHQMGDDVLKGVASCIRNNVREQDMVARYGGEEFSIILPETNKEDARKLAEGTRCRVSAQSFPYEETQPEGDLTISLGVATFPDDASDAVNLIKKADDALYTAKGKGRNRVEAA